MPYRSEYYDPPTEPSLPVLETPPTDAVGDDLFGYRCVRIGLKRRWHHCHRCKGWIEGDPNQYRVNTLGPLSGRMGIESYCRRCGHEIAFSGMMS